MVDTGSPSNEVLAERLGSVLERIAGIEERAQARMEKIEDTMDDFRRVLTAERITLAKDRVWIGLIMVGGNAIVTTLIGGAVYFFKSR